MTRTERTYFLLFGLYSLSWSFIGPIYAIYVLSRGLDLFQAGIVPAVYWIVAFLFEVPTGAFADVAGRKTAFLLSCTLRMTAFGYYAYARSFGEFLVAEFVDALGTTLANGALDAWAVDGMRTEGAGRSTERFFARAQMTGRAAIIAGGVAGGYLGQHNLTWPWFAAAASFATTGLTAVVAMREHRAHGAARAAGEQSFTRTMGAGLQAVRRTPVLFLLCGLTLAVAFATTPVYMYWPLRLQALTGANTGVLGWIWALICLASIAGSLLMLRLPLGYRRELLLGGVVLWRGAMLCVAALATRLAPVVAGLLMVELGFGVSEPLLQAWMNEHIAPDERATVLSVRSMCFTCGSGVGLIGAGFLARTWSISSAWLIAAALLGVTAPGFVILGTRLRRAGAPQTAGGAASMPLLPPVLG